MSFNDTMVTIMIVQQRKLHAVRKQSCKHCVQFYLAGRILFHSNLVKRKRDAFSSKTFDMPKYDQTIVSNEMADSHKK